MAPLEDLVLAALETELLTPELARTFAEEFNREVVRLTASQVMREQGSRARLKELEDELASLSANLLTGVVGPTIVGMITDRRRRGRPCSDAWSPFPRSSPH